MKSKRSISGKHIMEGMKKFLVTILAFFYLSSSMGATIHFHYCMGKLVDWTLWGSRTEQCNNCGMKKTQNTEKNGCCKDEYKHFKIEKDQKKTENNSQLNKFTRDFIVVHYAFQTGLKAPVSKNDYFKDNSPPLFVKIPIHILNSVFLI